MSENPVVTPEALPSVAETVAPPVAEVPPPPEPVAEAPPPPETPAPEPAATEPVAEAPAAEAAEANGAAAAPPPPPNNKKWYVVKVQSGREETIKEAVERRVKIENLEEFYGQIVIPTEKVVEMKNNKRYTRERKLYPGYLMVEVEYNDRILYLFRETSGVGDFVGGSVTHAPPPMSDREIQRMLIKPGDKQVPTIVAKPKFSIGDRVKINQGVFQGMEGEVKEIIEAKSLVRVEVSIFGRPVPHELEYWQVDPV